MNRLLRVVLIVALLAAAPLRGVAAPTQSHCADDASPAFTQAQDDGSQKSAHDDAGSEHCTGMSAIPSLRLSLPGDRSEERSRHSERFAIGFVPEHLDPPPLAR